MIPKRAPGVLFDKNFQNAPQVRSSSAQKASLRTNDFNMVDALERNDESNLGKKSEAAFVPARLAKTRMDVKTSKWNHVLVFIVDVRSLYSA